LFVEGKVWSPKDEELQKYHYFHDARPPFNRNYTVVLGLRFWIEKMDVWITFLVKKLFFKHHSFRSTALWIKSLQLLQGVQTGLSHVQDVTWRHLCV